VPAGRSDASWPQSPVWVKPDHGRVASFLGRTRLWPRLGSSAIWRTDGGRARGRKAKSVSISGATSLVARDVSGPGIHEQHMIALRANRG